MSLLSDWTEFLHVCSICKNLKYDGNFLIGEKAGPWLYFICSRCEDFLDQVERHNFDSDEGEK